jgi:thiamine pyrophosphate-dependent acetolactate synthase large subunit-like protein
MKNQFDGGTALVEAFRQLGVEYILSSPGTEWAPVWEAMADQIHRKKSGPKLLDVWHETLAVDIASGYTLATGRMQAVLLHAGAGLLQGAMGIHGAFVTGVPMVVISGESMTYGEQPEFDPGAQWIGNLSIVGGTTHLVNSIVKYRSVAGSVHTLYESVIRAGELAQRQPTGPVYLSVSTETLMEGWTPPANPRKVPAAPRVLTAPEDIEKLAAQLSKAKRPVVLTEGAGQEIETYEALVALCEKFALPVVEKPGALFANFPKDHPLYQGTDIKPFWNDMDLAIVVRARVPWYPPSNRPPKAAVAIVDEAPHNMAMAYQNNQADVYLEGDAAQTLRDLANAATVDKAAVDARRKDLAAAHDSLVEKRNAAQAAARKKTPIDPVWVCAALNSVMPEDAIYIDEVTTHTATLRQHLVWNDTQCLFTRQGGLGQGLGLSLGIKLGKPERQVVTLIGDGAFLYNPVLGSLGAARDYKLPTMAVIFNNKKYAAMQGMHQKMYPDGIAAEIDLYHGTHINPPDFVKVAECVGGYGEQVTDPEKLQDALKRGFEANQSGKPAIIDVIVA